MWYIKFEETFQDLLNLIFSFLKFCEVPHLHNDKFSELSVREISNQVACELVTVSALKQLQNYVP